jgi:hypothetical protein
VYNHLKRLAARNTKAVADKIAAASHNPPLVFPYFKKEVIEISATIAPMYK